MAIAEQDLDTSDMSFDARSLAKATNRGNTRSFRLAAALLFACVFAMSLLYVLDRRGALPIELRGHAVIAAVAATSLAVVAWILGWRALKAASRIRRVVFAALTITSVASIVVIAWHWTARYALPDSSPGARLGTPLPENARLIDENGAPFWLSSLHGRPTLLVWFRGAWCPYCRKQLARLQRALPEYRDSVHVVAVTGDPPELVRTMRNELGLEFPVLSDSSGELLQRCELMHCAAITDRGGIVRWSIVSGNWRQLDERTLLQAAYDAK